MRSYAEPLYCNLGLGAVSEQVARVQVERDNWTGEKATKTAAETVLCLLK